MDKKIWFILFLTIGIAVITVTFYYYSETARIAEYVALYTSVSTACYAILAEPKKRTEPYLRITPLLKRHAYIMMGNYSSPKTSGLNIWIENVGHSNAKNIEIRFQLVPDGSIQLKDNGVFVHPLLTPKEKVQCQAVKSAYSDKLLLQQLIVEASYSNEDEKKQKQIKNKWSVKELKEDLKEIKTS